MEKPTLVIGTSTNPGRYANMAIKSLVAKGFQVIAIGLREGTAYGVRIVKPFPEISGVDTITLYLGRKNQASYQVYILGLKPRRVIFNPGSENDELEERLEQAGIDVVHDCTLVMLHQGRY